MNVELINTGSEILLGSCLNTHLATLAEGLFPLGLRIGRQCTVPDGAAIGEALEESLSRADLIFVTGGLGPTTDDLTREIAAALLGRPLRHDPAVMEAITRRFEKFKLVLTERVARQARVPQGAQVLPNPHGTAPGLYLQEERAGRTVHLFLLPGPPRELQPMFTDHVLPILKTLAPQRAAQEEIRVYHVLGMGESNVEAAVGARLLALAGLELGYCARPGEVDVRCIGPRAVLEEAEAILQRELGSKIVSRDGRKVEEAVVEALTRRGETLALAESCTGGNLAHFVTNVAGASAVLLAGFVTYSNAAKTRDLGVPSPLLEEHGAVSAPVAAAMAEGALAHTGAAWALATTGIAGPTGATPGKPVGTVFIALARRGGATQVEERHFPRERAVFKDFVARAALALLLQAVARNAG